MNSAGWVAWSPRIIAVLAGALLSVSSAFGQIELPTEIKAKPGRLFRVEAKVPPNAVVVWDAGGGDIDFIPFPPPYTHIAVCVAPKSGRYRVIAIAAPAANKPAVAATILVIGDAPDPGPNPPEPKPPEPSPIPGGPRVLVTYETAELAKMPADKKLVLYSVRIRDYLNQKCAQDGKVKAWRIWDKDTDVVAESKEWKDMMARPRKTEPWLVINGKSLYEGPLPDNVEAMLELLKKHLE